MVCFGNFLDGRLSGDFPLLRIKRDVRKQHCKGKMFCKLGLFVADTFIQKRDYPDLAGISEQYFINKRINFLFNYFGHIKIIAYLRS